jgi:hypothetical protein
VDILTATERAEAVEYMVVGVRPTTLQRPPARRRAAERDASPIGVSDGLVLLVVFVAGALLRLWMLGHANMNSDEAIVGLMAHQIVHGHTTTFYWGQDYGGVEPYFVALMQVFGSSPLVVNLSASVLALAAAVLTWAVGRQVFTERAAVAAAALVWVWPEVNLWNSTRELGLHWIALVIGLLLILLTYRTRARHATAARLAAYGALAGLGWWATPEILYFVVPTVPYMLTAVRDVHRRYRVSVAKLGSVAGVSFLVASLPWWYTSVADRFRTLRNTGPAIAGNTYLDRLQIFFSHVLPMLLGLRIEGSGAWLGGTVGKVLYLCALVVIVAMAVCAVNYTRKAVLLVAVTVAFPFIYALFAATYFWNDARYGVYLPPFIALLTLGGLSAVVSGRHLRAFWPVVVAGCLFATVLSVRDTFPTFSVAQAIEHPIGPTNVVANDLAGAMVAHHLHAGYASYWIAYDTDFASGEAVELSPATPDVRSVPIERAVQGSKRVAYVFVDQAQIGTASTAFGSTDLNPGTLTEQSLIASLRSRGIAYQVFSVGPLVVVSTSFDSPPT